MIRQVSVATLVLLTIAMAGCVSSLPTEEDLVGVWESDGPDRASVLDLDVDGTFTVTAIPVSALGPVPRSIDWARVVDTKGTWSYGDDSNRIDFHFEATDMSGGYFGPAIVETVDGRYQIGLQISADQDIYLEYVRPPN